VRLNETKKWEIIMPNDFFNFKQFTISQDKCAMKVGTDGVLLGAWTNTNNKNKILDIGSGSGLISLMLAQRCDAEIYSVEIDENAANQSKENILNSPWSSRLHIVNTSIQKFTIETDHKFDLIVSNPPYFINSLKPSANKRVLARHTDSLSHQDILISTTKLLSENGLLAIILPYAEACLFIVEAAKFGVFCVRKTNVKPKPHTPVKRLLMEFSFSPAPCAEDILIIETSENKVYSDKYKTLTNEFYLQF
jgi:tRNA1Val (adenine37-N6)-methyltransferase